MNHRIATRIKRLTSAALSAALTLSSGGLPAFAQQLVATPGGAVAAGLGAAGASVSASGAASAAGPGLALDVRVGGSLAAGASTRPEAIGSAGPQAEAAAGPFIAGAAASPILVAPAGTPSTTFRPAGSAARPSARGAASVGRASPSDRASAPAACAVPEARPGRSGSAVDPAPVVGPPSSPNPLRIERVAEGAAREADSANLGALRGLEARREPGRLFDGLGILPIQKPHPLQDILDDKPGYPTETGARTLSWDLSEAPRGLGLSRPGLLRRALSRLSGAARSGALPGDPQTDAGVEQALRRLIQDRPDLFDGVRPENLLTVLANKVAGREGVDDTVYVRFRQRQYHPALGEFVAVEGSHLDFVVKLRGGKAVIVGSTARLYPRLAVETEGRTLGREEILSRAREKLGLPPNEALPDLRDLGPRIMQLGRGNDDRKWRTVQILGSEKKMVLLAVDVRTGEAFAWDPRVSARAGSGGDDGAAVGRGIAEGPIEGGTPSVLPLGHIEIRTADGRSFFADKDGKFKVEGSGADPVALTVRLSGRYAAVTDAQGRDLVVAVTARPGEELRVVFNPDGAEENHLAQVNAYYHTTLVHDWLADHGIRLPGLDKPMPVEVNIDDECNAYYTPWNPSLHFFRMSERCANTSYGDVNYHEYGHAYDDASDGAGSAARLAAISVLSILNGGLSEGIGDMLMVLITGQPVVGRGFFRGQNPGGIRDGRNDYQYRDSDEAHKQGQAFVGFVWKLREALIASAGDAVRGAELTVALVLPIVLAKPRDIPAAIQQVLLRDMDANGKIPHLKEIRAAAAAHGIQVRPPSAGNNAARVPARLARAFGR